MVMYIHFYVYTIYYTYMSKQFIPVRWLSGVIFINRQLDIYIYYIYICVCVRVSVCVCVCVKTVYTFVLAVGVNGHQ